MSIVENLLLNNLDTKSSNKTNVKQGNFLLDLIKNIKDNNELLDILKNLNIDENKLNDLIKNIKDDQKLIDKIKNLIKYLKNNQPNIKLNNDESNNDIDIKLQDIKTNISQANNDSKKEELLKNLINKPINNDKLEKHIKKEIDSSNETQNLQIIETKIVDITKNIIESKHILEKLKLTDKQISEFKNIDNLKDLVKFANKNGLNISKIIISSQKEEKTINNNENELKPKISLNKINFNNKKNKKENNTNILNNILNKKNTKPDISTNINSNIIKNHNQQSINKSNNKTVILKENTKTNILQTLITDQKSISSNEKKEINLLNLTSEKDNKHKLPENHNTNIQTPQIDINTLKQNIMKSKETIKHFATNIKEAVENYKPPISKLSLELHPKELGKVEVTLIHRGDNLQIQINSNNTAISMFHTAQNELRQNLINMGFTDVNMSFNQQQEKGKQEYQKNQKRSEKEEDELIIEIPYQYA